MKSIVKKALLVTLCAVIATPAMQAEGWGNYIAGGLKNHWAKLVVGTATAACYYWKSKQEQPKAPASAEGKIEADQQQKDAVVATPTSSSSSSTTTTITMGTSAASVVLTEPQTQLPEFPEVIGIGPAEPFSFDNKEQSTEKNTWTVKKTLRCLGLFSLAAFANNLQQGYGRKNALLWAGLALAGFASDGCDWIKSKLSNQCADGEQDQNDGGGEE